MQGCKERRKRLILIALRTPTNLLTPCRPPPLQQMHRWPSVLCCHGDSHLSSMLPWRLPPPTAPIPTSNPSCSPSTSLLHFLGAPQLQTLHGCPHTHAHTHARTHTRTHTYTHTQTNTHTSILDPPWPNLILAKAVFTLILSTSMSAKI